jgi:hypothetical protein
VHDRQVVTCRPDNSRTNSKPTELSVRGTSTAGVGAGQLLQTLGFYSSNINSATTAANRSIIIIKFYVCMYVYCPFSPHNGITTGNVLILFFSPVKSNFKFF